MTAYMKIEYQRQAQYIGDPFAKKRAYKSQCYGNKTAAVRISNDSAAYRTTDSCHNQ